LKRAFLLILTSILFLGCNSKIETTVDDFIDNYSFNKTKSNSKEIIITLYDTTITKRRITDVEFFPPKKEFKALNKQQLESFDRLFINAEKTGYCCCPTAIYSVHFLNKKEELDLFYVDTLQFKNKVRIYEKGLQYSYIIEKQKWKDYLAEIQKK
jgi:hypothetical protein